MSGGALRLACAGLLSGIAIGVWTTNSHFRPLLDHQRDKAAQCSAARDNLAGLAQEQGKALGDLTLAANARKAEAVKAAGKAKASADIDYTAANRLQQERTGGDQCAAATSIIDKELGL
ncbi:hypothetical protein [Pseudomonas fortuita]|uniref:hypothetical protein n=1 Tax=Pseudomonas fortuita TaxID=3233375 RepID=UPI003C2F6DB8